MESDRAEVYVAPFPKADSKSLISTAGGSWARWRQDGKEIFYLAPGNMLMAAQVDGLGSAVKVGNVRSLFVIRTPPTTEAGYTYDVSPNGQSFLVNTVDEESTSARIVTVVNWLSATK